MVTTEGVLVEPSSATLVVLVPVGSVPCQKFVVPAKAVEEIKVTEPQAGLTGELIVGSAGPAGKFVTVIEPALADHVP